MQYPIADACANMNKLECTHYGSSGHSGTRRVSPAVPRRTGGNKTQIKKRTKGADKPVQPFRYFGHLMILVSFPGYLLTNVMKIITHLKVKSLCTT
jgi:hypothetical protein